MIGAQVYVNRNDYEKALADFDKAVEIAPNDPNAYHNANNEEATQLFKWLRGNTYKLIKNLPEATWAHTVNHSENGTMTMDDWLDVYDRHVPEHLAQMERIYEEWKATKGKRRNKGK